jgi:hypothetical protein
MASDQTPGCVDDAQRLMDRVDSALSRSGPRVAADPASHGSGSAPPYLTGCDH